MGATVSRPGGVENPFPVGPALSKDLDLLTTVAVRLLSSSDIYDIANLENPGVCGSYAVFLKKNIEKRLLSFAADLSGGETVEILYQDPSKAIPAGKRREICKRLAGTMVTLVATVVALLASIQVKSDSRSAAARGSVPAPARQAGGASVVDIIEWLQANGYIRSAPIVRPTDSQITLELYNEEIAKEFRERAPKFTLRLNTRISSRRTYDGTLTAHGGADFPPRPTPALPPPPPLPAFPKGSLQVQLMAPIRVPGTPTEESILPFRIADSSDVPWMAGALYKSLFFTAAPDPADPTAVSPFDVWTDIFRRTQRIDIPSYRDARETRANINRAAEVFTRYAQTQDPRPFLQAMATLLSIWAEYRPEVVGYPPVTMPGYPPVAVGPYGYPPPIPPPAYPRPPPPPITSAALRPAAPTLAGATVTSIPAPTTATYDLSKPSADVILRTLRNYRQLIPDESSPAAVRAFTLAGKVNPDRTVNTDVCNDPYWRLGGLHLIYPWATLQFLCVNNWEKLGTSGGKDVFHPIWTTFLNGLRGLYPDASGNTAHPRIAGPKENQVLNGLTFTQIGNPAICKDSRSPRVRFIKVQDGLLTLQGRYERHVRRVWEILNSLIVVIVDPETREQTVRLHPNVYGSASGAYVEKQAATAREALTEFYLGVETDYLKTVDALTPLN
jgi:hypothetical protein